MDKNEVIKPDENILQIFQELQEKANAINPSLLADIQSFNENHVALESYQNFINTLNQSPLLTTSNFVSK